jgi:cellobiose phosphorylase
VRENGGQYTHGAIWLAMAFAQLGDSRRAWELVAMINPVNHTKSAEAIATYKVEPYAVAADVYGVHPHTGRGGWTWYTGSAGWLYRLILESLLGLKREDDKLTLTPLLPPDWDRFTIHYRYRATTYHIVAQRDKALSVAGRVTLDGTLQAGTTITLVDDRRDHSVTVYLPSDG